MAEKIAVSLPIEGWQTLVNLLAEHPYKVSAPLIQDILTQVQADRQEASAPTTFHPSPNSLNGHLAEKPDSTLASS